MKRLFLCILFLVAFLFFAPSAKANSFFVQSVFVPQVVVVPTNADLFFSNGIGCNCGFSSAVVVNRGFGFNSAVVSSRGFFFGGASAAAVSGRSFRGGAAASAVAGGGGGGAAAAASSGGGGFFNRSRAVAVTRTGPFGRTVSRSRAVSR